MSAREQTGVDLSINIKGYLMDLKIPKVMGILNVTPDSFYSGSRVSTIEGIRHRVVRMLDEGADIIDVGGCSTRPGFRLPDEEEEMERIALGCRIVREISSEIPLSVDTFRASVAKMAINEYEADIINDISGGADADMWPLVGAKKVAYVLTHNRFEIPEKEATRYTDVTAEVIIELSKKVNELHRLGVNDVIIDPGFGFSKTVEQNFILLEELHEIVRMGLPVMVGLSRKSMIYKTLETTPDDSLAGSLTLDTIALEKGADILRVHDVKEAVQSVKLMEKLRAVEIH